MEKKVQCFYACPECGALMPYLQRRCDCGYRLRRRWPKDRRLVVAVAVLSVALILAVGVIFYQQESLPAEGYDAGYAAALAEEETVAGSFAEWSDARQAAKETAPISTLPPLTSPPVLPDLRGLPPLVGGG